MKVVGLVLTLLLSGTALSAPTVDPKFVDVWSRMDEFNAWRGVRKADAPREFRYQKNEDLDGLVGAFMEANQNTGLIVLKGDALLAERYQYGRTPEHRLASASVAKTVLAMLVGIALHEKKISSIDDLASRYVSDLKGHPYGETSIRHLLTMSSGIAVESENRLIVNTLRQKTQGGADTVLEWKREAPAGTRFRYNSADSEVLGLVLFHATRTPVATYLSEKIWQPMGAEANATWLVDKGGFETGFCCINARLRDYARFGMLLANYGALDGKEIIPAGWVKAATTPERPHLAVGKATPNNGYGYQTWITSRAEPPHFPRFAALGIRGQAIFVDPARKIVVVHTAVWADARDRTGRRAQFKLFEEILTKLESQ